MTAVTNLTSKVSLATQVVGSGSLSLQASYFIFEKMKLDGMNQTEDVRLRTAIRIPKAMVGRVIGKSGKNVREIQRMTGASVKLPEDPNTQGEEVLVEVHGNFMATQVYRCTLFMIHDMYA